MGRPLTVVKVGGSLYDLPDLGLRLQDSLAWLGKCPSPTSCSCRAAGRTADVIRDFDRIHHLGEERAHRLALTACG